MTNIYERLPGLAANARNFVTQLDAPTLHDRLNKLATACDQAHAEITTLRAQVAAGDAMRAAYHALESDINEETEQSFIDALDAFYASKEVKP